MPDANTCATGRDLTTIPLRGHLIHVWRQPEPAKRPCAWRVVRDDQHTAGAGEADTDAEAWAAALALVHGDDAPAADQRQREPLLAGADAAVRALWHAANLARAAQAFAERAILEPAAEEAARDGARHVVKDVLETLARDADAAAERLWGVCSTTEGADHA